jgi:nucleoside-diphosphate-sugar epimerase
MILVTGGTGLVGSHLLLALARNNDAVRAIHRPGSGLDAVRYVFSLYEDDPDVLYKRIEWVLGDLEDPESLNIALNDIHQVYHCAAMVSFDPGEKKKMVRANVSGTSNLVNACLDKGVRKFCHVSSTAALGAANGDPLVTEKMVWGPSKYRSAYSESKFLSEMEVWRGMAEGLNAVIVNPSIVIGPGNWERSSARLFSAVWNGLKFYTEGVTGYVDVRDVVSAMIALMSSDISGERFIISSENLSYRQVLDMIARELNRPPPSIYAGSVLISIAWRLDWLKNLVPGKRRSITRTTVRSSKKKTYFDNTKISGVLGLRFRSMEDSIRDTARIFLENNPQGKQANAQS